MSSGKGRRLQSAAGNGPVLLMQTAIGRTAVCGLRVCVWLVNIGELFETPKIIIQNTPHIVFKS